MRMASTRVFTQRAALGTTAATHLTAAPVLRWAVPSLAAELNLAYAINNVLQRQSGYARTSGSGDNETEYTGRGIRWLEKQALSAIGRQARTRAV